MTPFPQHISLQDIDIFNISETSTDNRRNLRFLSFPSAVKSFEESNDTRTQMQRLHRAKELISHALDIVCAEDDDLFAGFQLSPRSTL